MCVILAFLSPITYRVGYLDTPCHVVCICIDLRNAGCWRKGLINAINENFNPVPKARRRRVPHELGNNDVAISFISAKLVWRQHRTCWSRSYAHLPVKIAGDVGDGGGTREYKSVCEHALMIHECIHRGSTASPDLKNNSTRSPAEFCVWTHLRFCEMSVDLNCSGMLVP